MRIARFTWRAVLAVCCGYSAALAGDLPQDLVDNYGPAVAKIQKVYDHVTIRGTVIREFPQRRESLTQEYTLRNSGKQSRLDIKTTASRNGNLPVGLVEAYLATPEASFYGVGNNGTLAIDTASELTYSDAMTRINSAFPVDEPYALASGSTVLEMLKRPQVNIGEVKKLMHKGQPFVKIVYDHPISGGAQNLDDQLSYVLLSPNEGWAVREYSRTTGRGPEAKTSKGKITYSEVKDGVPVIGRMESWEYEGENRTLVLHEVVNISRFDLGDPQMIYFGADGFN